MALLGLVYAAAAVGVLDVVNYGWPYFTGGDLGEASWVDSGSRCWRRAFSLHMFEGNNHVAMDSDAMKID